MYCSPLILVGGLGRLWSLGKGSSTLMVWYATTGVNGMFFGSQTFVSLLGSLFRISSRLSNLMGSNLMFYFCLFLLLKYFKWACKELRDFDLFLASPFLSLFISGTRFNGNTNLSLCPVTSTPSFSRDSLNSSLSSCSLRSTLPTLEENSLYMFNTWSSWTDADFKEGITSTFSLDTPLCKCSNTESLLLLKEEMGSLGSLSYRSGLSRPIVWGMLSGNEQGLRGYLGEIRVCEGITSDLL